MKTFKIMSGCQVNDWRVDFPKLSALCPGEPFTVYSPWIAYHYNESGEFICREEIRTPDNDVIPVFELPAAVETEAAAELEAAAVETDAENGTEKPTFEQARDIIRNLLWEARKDYRLRTDSGVAGKAIDSLYWGRVQALRNALEKLDAL